MIWHCVEGCANAKERAPTGERDNKICLEWVAVDLVSVITKAYCSRDLAHSDSDIQYTYKISDKPWFACVIMCEEGKSPPF